MLVLAYKHKIMSTKSTKSVFIGDVYSYNDMRDVIGRDIEILDWISVSQDIITI